MLFCYFLFSDLIIFLVVFRLKQDILDVKTRSRVGHLLQSSAELKISSMGSHIATTSSESLSDYNLVDSIDDLIRLGYVSGEKRPNPRGRKKRMKIA